MATSPAGSKASPRWVISSGRAERMPSGDSAIVTPASRPAIDHKQHRAFVATRGVHRAGRPAGVVAGPQRSVLVIERTRKHVDLLDLIVGMGWKAGPGVDLHQA